MTARRGGNVKQFRLPQCFWLVAPTPEADDRLVESHGDCVAAGVPCEVHRAESVVLELPLPPEVLHPNKKTDVRNYRAASVRKARGEACMMLRIRQSKSWPWKRAAVATMFFMPRSRDEDGLVAWLKAYLDGFADAGIVANDSAFRVCRPSQVTGRAAGRKLFVVITRDE